MEINPQLTPYKLNSDKLCQLIWSEEPFIKNNGEFNELWFDYVKCESSQESSSWTKTFKKKLRPKQLLIDLLTIPDSQFHQLPFYVVCRTGNYHLIKFFCKIPELIENLESKGLESTSTDKKEGRNFLHGLYWTFDSKKKLVDIFRITKYFIKKSEIKYDFFLHKCDDKGEEPLYLFQNLLKHLSFEIKYGSLFWNENTTTQINNYCDVVLSMKSMFDDLLKYKDDLNFLLNSNLINKIIISNMKLPDIQDDKIGKILKIKSDLSLRQKELNNLTKCENLTVDEWKNIISDYLINVHQKNSNEIKNINLNHLYNEKCLNIEIEKLQLNLVSKYKDYESVEILHEILIENFDELLIVMSKEEKMIKLNLYKDNYKKFEYIMKSKQSNCWQILFGMKI